MILRAENFLATDFPNEEQAVRKAASRVTRLSGASLAFRRAARPEAQMLQRHQRATGYHCTQAPKLNLCYSIGLVTIFSGSNLNDAHNVARVPFGLPSSVSELVCSYRKTTPPVQRAVGLSGAKSQALQQGTQQPPQGFVDHARRRRRRGTLVPSASPCS